MWSLQGNPNLHFDLPISSSLRFNSTPKLEMIIFVTYFGWENSQPNPQIIFGVGKCHNTFTYLEVTTANSCRRMCMGLSIYNIYCRLPQIYMLKLIVLIWDWSLSFGRGTTDPILLWSTPAQISLLVTPRATSHMSQEPWPWNCESPKESVQRSSKTPPKSCSVVTDPWV